MKQLVGSLLAATALGASASAYAQEVVMDGAIIAYAPEFFGVYSPVTALDMVSQVPGFGIDNGQPVRGLADTFANVLIDGERQSTYQKKLDRPLIHVWFGRS